MGTSRTLCWLSVLLVGTCAGCASQYHWYNCNCPPYVHCPYAPPAFGQYPCTCQTPGQQAIKQEGADAVQPLATP